MGTIFAYSVTVSLILTLAYGGYLLSRKGSAKLRRSILLGIYALALVGVPMLMSVDFNRMTDQPIVNNMSHTLPVVEISGGVDASVSVFDVLLRIYVGGVAVCALLTLFELFRVVLLLRKCEKQKIDGQTVYVHRRKDISPFSLGNIMVANAADIENAAVMMHERTHISCRHTLDLCVAQLAAILCWYCPTVWYMSRELKLVHEFQADEAVVDHGTDSRTYCRLLVERAAGIKIMAIANSLNHNNLKQRIIMMQTSKTEHKSGRSRVLLPLLAVVGSAMVLSVPSVSNAIGQISRTELIERSIGLKGKGPAFVIYGVDTKQEAIKKGKFQALSDFESSPVRFKDVDGVILVNTGAIICADKKVLSRLTPNVKKYIVDGRVVSAKEFSQIPASELYRVVVSGNSMSVFTTNHIDAKYTNVFEDVIRAENR